MEKITYNSSDHPTWLLCPVVGEITKCNFDYLKASKPNESKSTHEYCDAGVANESKSVVEEIKVDEPEEEYYITILCEPVDKKPIVTCCIYKEGFCRKIQFYPERIGPNKITIKAPEPGIYKLLWYQNVHQSQIFDDLIEMVARNIVSEYLLIGQDVYQHRVVVKSQPDSFIFVSCDLLEAETDKKHSMWNKMLTEVKESKQTCIVHIGDQAYMDKVYKESVKLVKENGMSDEISDFILTNFGKRYCDTWRPHNFILSQTTNYNLWDDHELTNNMTLNSPNLSKEELYVRDLAVQAYIKYQDSTQPYASHMLSAFSWYKLFDNIIIIAIEHNARDIKIDEVLTALNILSCNLSFNKIILCFSSAPIPPPTGFTGDIYKEISDYKGGNKFWHHQDLYNLYDGLLTWLESDLNRELVLLGGDLHFGVHGFVRRGNVAFDVAISSPITNQPTVQQWIAAKGMPKVHRLITNNTARMNEISYKPIIYRTLSAKAKRCYVVVDQANDCLNTTIKYSKEKFLKGKLF